MNDEIEPLNVIIFAGPNGSGKSTLTKAVTSSPDFKGEYINADDIAKTLESTIPDRTTRELRAAQVADQRRQTAIAEHRTFAFETVMSTESKVAIMTQARAAGYEVDLVFVTLASPDLNVKRVEHRVAKGGHPVDPEKIRSRYTSAMALLPAAVEHSDNANIFDNSLKQRVLVAQKRDGQLILTPDAKVVPWVQEKLWTPHQARQESLDAIRSVYAREAASGATTLQCRLKEADAGDGKRYSGKVLAVTKHHYLQQVGANVFVVHDRALLAPIEIMPGKAQTIQYAYKAGKAISPGLDKALGPDRTR